jgi:hypothetical protein
MVNVLGVVYIFNKAIYWKLTILNPFLVEVRRNGKISNYYIAIATMKKLLMMAA